VVFVDGPGEARLSYQLDSGDEDRTLDPATAWSERHPTMPGKKTGGPRTAHSSEFAVVLPGEWRIGQKPARR